MPGEDLREQLLRAALDILVERGYAETRILDVAERTGISPGVVIFHFKNRDDLLTEALRYWEDAWHATTAASVAGVPDAAGQLSRLILMTYDPEPDLPGGSWLLWLDLWALAPRSPAVAAARREFDERWYQMFREIVLRGRDAGEFGEVDVDEFILTLTALMDGLALRFALGDPDCDSTRAHDLAMAYALARLAPRVPGARSSLPGQRPSGSTRSPAIARS